MPDFVTAPVPPPSSLPQVPKTRRLSRHGPPKTVATLQPDGNYRYPGGQIPAIDGNNKNVVNWTHRHTLVLWMHIAGQKPKVIAESLGYNVKRISSIVNSPLFKSRMSEELEKLKGATFTDFLEMVRKSTPETFQGLLDLRSAPDDKIKLGASRACMAEADRLWPKHTEHKEEKVIRMVFDQESLRCMAVAMAEVKGVDAKTINASYKKVTEAPEKPYEAIQADEFLKEIEEAAAVELDGVE